MLKKINPQKLLIQLIIITIGALIGISAFSGWNKENISRNGEVAGGEVGIETQPQDLLSSTTREPKGVQRQYDEAVARPIDPSTNSLTIITGSTKTNLTFTEGQTLYEIFNSKENVGKINFRGKEYTGIGFFVTDIGELHSGGGNDLLYYVNGVEANSGISVYKPKVGDVVEWKLE